MTDQPVNPVADDGDDDVSDLVADALASSEELDADNAEESDEEESDEIVNGLNLADLPDQIRDFITGVIVGKANAAVERFKAADDVIAASLNRDSVVMLKFRDTGTEDYILEARAEYDRLHNEADALREKTEARIRELMEESATPEQIETAKEKRKAARADYEAQAKFANEQLLEPAEIIGDVRSLFEPLPKATGDTKASGSGGGSTGPKPRVKSVSLYENGNWNLVTMPVQTKEGPKKRSNFTALKMRLTALTGETPKITDLHSKWYEAAGTTNWQNISATHEFEWPGKDGATLKVQVVPAEQSA